jgi:hypothetical protein
MRYNFFLILFSPPALMRERVFNSRFKLFEKKYKLFSNKFGQIKDFRSYILKRYLERDFPDQVLPKLSFLFFKKNLLTFLEQFSGKEITQIIKRLNNHQSKLMHIVARNTQSRFKLIRPSGEVLSPASKTKMQNLYGNETLSYSPVKKGNFKPAMQNGNLQLLVERSPPEKLNKIKSKLPNPYQVEEVVLQKMIDYFLNDDLPDHLEKFEFKVTREIIHSRKGKSRFQTQKQVMNGKPAIEVLIELGLPICPAEDGRKYHWAHRHGWAVGGEQAKENLDPSTAGSNYQTLFKVEKPIHDLLFSQQVDTVNVSGLVLFHDKIFELEKKRVAIQVLYVISSDKVQEPIYVCIDPLSHQSPTMQEAYIASMFAMNQLSQCEEFPSEKILARKLDFKK